MALSATSSGSLGLMQLKSQLTCLRFNVTLTLVETIKVCTVSAKVLDKIYLSTQFKWQVNEVVCKTIMLNL